MVRVMSKRMEEEDGRVSGLELLLVRGASLRLFERWTLLSGAMEVGRSEVVMDHESRRWRTGVGYLFDSLSRCFFVRWVGGVLLVWLFIISEASQGVDLADRRAFDVFEGSFFASILSASFPCMNSPYEEEQQQPRCISNIFKNQLQSRWVEYNVL